MHDRTQTYQRPAVVSLVVLMHVGGLWALQNGLLRRAVEVIVPVQVLADFVAPPQPQVQPAPTPPRPQPEPPRPRPAPFACLRLHPSPFLPCP